MSYKKVNIPLEVPVGKYCCDGGRTVCEKFDVNGYGSGCGLRLGYSEEDRKGRRLKPEKCISLVDILES